MMPPNDKYASMKKPAPLPLLKRLGALLLAACCLVMPAAAQALSDQDQADVARIESYLNGVRSLEARFVQVAPDGSISEGRVLMRRPGRMRFEYDPPVPILLVADGNFMIFHDKQLKQTSHIPLGSTPLSFLVQEKIDFAKAANIERIERGPGALRMTVSDPKKTRDGKITLVFSDQPMLLKQWVVQDGNGQQTTVALSQMQTNIPLKSDLFYFVDMSPR